MTKSVIYSHLLNYIYFIFHYCIILFQFIKLFQHDLHLNLNNRLNLVELLKILQGNAKITVKVLYFH